MAVRREVSFKSDGIELRGHLYLPEGSRPAPGLVFSGPFTGVKEQVTGVYARRLAERGFVALTFDHRNFGESSGAPRQHEDSSGKLSDLGHAISFLRELPEVLRDQVGACGICLGAGYILKLAAFDPRVRAVALIAGAYNSPMRMREAMGPMRYRERLARFGELRQKQDTTGEIEYMAAVAPEGPAAMGGSEPFEYYGTDRSAPRGGWENRVTSLSVASLLTFDAFSAASFISPTPLLVVHGETDAYCSPETALAMFELVGEPKQVVWLPTTNHIDLYDRAPFVNPAVDASAAWFDRWLSKDSDDRSS